MLKKNEKILDNLTNDNIIKKYAFNKYSRFLFLILFLLFTLLLIIMVVSSSTFIAQDLQNGEEFVGLTAVFFYSIAFIPMLVAFILFVKCNKHYKKHKAEIEKREITKEEIKNSVTNLVKTRLILLALVAVIMAVFMLFSSLSTGSKDNNKNNSSATCYFCHDARATKGKYCASCYRTLSNIKDAYE